jgi:hypothetical protein
MIDRTLTEPTPKLQACNNAAASFHECALFLICDTNRQFPLSSCCHYFNLKRKKIMAKETVAKENPVVDALKKLKDEEAELLTKLKPMQEAISALEKIVDKSVKKLKTKDASDNLTVEERELVMDAE